MLHTLLPYCRGGGIDARWFVIDGDPEFFAVTKRVDNGLSGVEGDRGLLDDKARKVFELVSRENAEELRRLVRAGDVVILHDPQTAALVDPMKRAGAHVVWRGHNGADQSNDHVDRSWQFLRNYLEAADAFVLSRASFTPPWMHRHPVDIISPFLDPFTPKNQELSPSTVLAILFTAGIVQGDGPLGTPSFIGRDGRAATVALRADVLRNGPPPSAYAPMVVQVARWDRIKDMTGVLRGFAGHVAPARMAHLTLVGPETGGVADDPEAKEAFDECHEAWQQLPLSQRRRIQLVRLPMQQPEENAAVVNAVQRHAAVIVQKSLSEGFGLTVTEAMWKSRPVVASAVGGIKTQIVHQQHGLLLNEPTDLGALGDSVTALLDDMPYRAQLAAQARQRVIERFITDRPLGAEATVLLQLLDPRPHPKRQASR